MVNNFGSNCNSLTSVSMILLPARIVQLMIGFRSKYFRMDNKSILLLLLLFINKCKGMFLYSALSSLLNRSKHIHFTHWQTCSFRHQIGFSGNHSSQAAITCEDYSPHFHRCL